jgi:hypothetical protein
MEEKWMANKRHPAALAGEMQAPQDAPVARLVMNLGPRRHRRAAQPEQPKKPSSASLAGKHHPASVTQRGGFVNLATKDNRHSAVVDRIALVCYDWSELAHPWPLPADSFFDAESGAAWEWNVWLSY